MKLEKKVIASEDANEIIEQTRSILSQLKNGDGVEVSTTVDPTPALQDLLDNNWGEFDWHPLERGANSYRFALIKLDTPSPNMTIREFMSRGHVWCDDLYAEMEAVALEGDVETTKQLFSSFELAMLQHFDMEENVLFAELENRGVLPTGMGPLAVMRMEHDQMKGVIHQMSQAATNSDTNGITSLGETLIILIQQHNVKEEDIVYAMATQSLATEQGIVLKKMMIQ